MGGARGNALLTSLLGAVLLVLLAVEGATIPWINQLLSVHVFVGLLLLGPVAVKLASTGYRFASYYGGGAEYVRRGPPVPVVRFVVAPVLVLSTLVLFGTGVALVVSPARGAVLGLHKASFVVWFGAMTVHVLLYAWRVGRHLVVEAGRRVRGRGYRLALVLVAVAAGLVVAVAAYPQASPWFNGLAAEGKDDPPPAGTTTDVKTTRAALPAAVESGLLPWGLHAPLSREVVLPQAGTRGLIVFGGLTSGSASTAAVELLDTRNGVRLPARNPAPGDARRRGCLARRAAARDRRRHGGPGGLDPDRDWHEGGAGRRAPGPARRRGRRDDRAHRVPRRRLRRIGHEP